MNQRNLFNPILKFTRGHIKKQINAVMWKDDARKIVKTNKKIFFFNANKIAQRAKEQTRANRMAIKSPLINVSDK
jgi:hypothetical protein